MKRGARSLARIALAVAATFLTSVAPAHDSGSMLDWSRAPRDTLPWGALAKVAVRDVDGRLVPLFLPPVLELDGKPVTLYGFMAPAGEERRGRQFLLTERPLTCGSCDPVSPEGIVEVNTRSPVAETPQAIAVRGVLHVLRSDPKNVLYRLTDARVVSRQRPR